MARGGIIRTLPAPGFGVNYTGGARDNVPKEVRTLKPRLKGTSVRWTRVGSHQRRKLVHLNGFFLHFVAEGPMQALDLREVPVEGRDRVGHVEQAGRPS